MDYLNTALEDVHKEVLVYFNDKEKYFLKYDIGIDIFIETYERQITYLTEKFFEQTECKLHYYNYLKKDEYCVTTLGGYEDFLCYLRNNSLSFNSFNDVLVYINQTQENKDNIFNLTKRWYFNTITAYNIRESLINTYAHYVYGLMGNWFKLLFLSSGHQWYIEDIEYGVTYKDDWGKTSNNSFRYLSDAKKEFNRLVKDAKKVEWVDEMASGRICSGVEIIEDGYEISKNGRHYNMMDDIVSGVVGDDIYRGINSSSTSFYAYTEIAKRFISINIKTYRTSKLRIGYEK